MQADTLARWLEWVGTPNCTCPSAYKSFGRLYGVSMGKGWMRLETNAACPHHGQRR